MFWGLPREGTITSRSPVNGRILFLHSGGIHPRAEERLTMLVVIPVELARLEHFGEPQVHGLTTPRPYSPGRFSHATPVSAQYWSSAAQTGDTFPSHW